MALKTIVKVGNITNLSDARYCAGMGVEMLGFDLNPKSEAYVSPEFFKEISGWVAGVKYVGECAGMPAQEIKKVLGDYELDLIEIDEESLELALDTGMEYILKSVKVPDQLPDGVTFIHREEAVQNDKVSNAKLLIGGNLDDSKVLKLIENTSVSGICLQGSTEDKPGFKDYDALADILEALEID
ncbi:MAG: hypothetical protein RJQ09_19455 [Cyclobacteriaceae bacterium]